MSRIAKNPINIPEKTEISISEKKFSVKGSHGELSINIPNGYEIEKDSNTIIVKTKNEELKESPNWGTIRALVANAITGVSQGFTKNLELHGTGYKAMIAGNALKLSLGYSHDINYEIPKEVKIVCPKQNIINLSSFDKEKLGAAAAKIRSFRKPEPFKGKGIKYSDEYIFRKEGKKK